MADKATVKKDTLQGKSLKNRGFKQVSLPIKLIEYIETFIEDNKHLGYTSIPDFIRSAIRDKLKL